MSIPDGDIDELTPRAEIFRSKLIQTFGLLDSLQGTQDVPKYYSSELAESPEMMDDMMINHPEGLVKFKVYSHDENEKRCTDLDRRLNKVRMKGSFGIYCIGPWAKEITENKRVQMFMSYLIFFNSIGLGIQSELVHTYPPDSTLLWCFDMFDDISLVIFVFEIILKIVDQRNMFWKNGWNNFDFAITMMTLVIAIIDQANKKQNTKGDLSSIGILKVFRILRSLKMLTRFAQLRLIVLTILKALRSIGVITFLLIILIYLFAVMGLILFKAYSNPIKMAGFQSQEIRYGTINITQRFGSFVNSTIMVFQLFTVDSWHTLFKQVEKDNLVKPVGYLYLCYFYVIAWLFIGAILFKNIFVGIMVMNFKTIRDDFLEQCSEREKELELGQKGLLLEVELAISHAKQSNQTDSDQKKSSLMCGYGSGVVPLFKQEDLINASQMLINRDSTPSLSEIKGAPFHETVLPSLSDEKLQKQQDQQVRGSSQQPQPPQETPRESASDIDESNIKDFLAGLKQTRSMMMDEAVNQDKFPECASWNDTVRANFKNFDSGKETMWPRDTLFRYIQCMETLQDNLAERHQLQRLSVRAISNMFDSNFLHQH